MAQAGSGHGTSEIEFTSSSDSEGNNENRHPAFYFVGQHLAAFDASILEKEKGLSIVKNDVISAVSDTTGPYPSAMTRR